MIKGIIGTHRRTLLICICISFALYMTAAWRSAIYLHPDEYYQIVEFASYKMGITAPDQMAWEFGEKIRPAFQPLMCYSIMKAMNTLHISDHYTQLYLLRVLSALLSLFSITLFCISSLPVINDAYRRTYIIASYLFWYPYTYGVHFSSETWSGCMVIIAISLLVLYYPIEKKKPLILFPVIGLLLGAAFLLRFQTAFISLGILLWLLFMKWEKASNILLVVLSGALLLAAGTLMDRWFYGEWLCTPWRYFDSAFIHQHTEFGSKPFYFYALFLTLMLTPPIGLIVVIAILAFLYTQPKTLYAWALIPFLLFHTIIGHKEFRFMYPVITFFPLVVVMAYQGLRDKGINLPRPLVNITKGAIIIFNILGLIIFVFFSDRFLFDSKIFCDHIHRMAKQKTVVVYCKDINNSPYVLPKATIPKDLFPEYMRDRNVSNILTDDLKQTGVSNKDTLKLIATNKYEYDRDIRYRGKIVQSTLIDLTWLRGLAGDEAYKGIEENTYYLIEN